jgi:energy-coupling factor transport system permease protein
MDERMQRARRPLQFRAGSSRIHRLGAGWKLLAATAIGAAGLAIDSPLALLALIAAVAIGYPAARLQARDLWSDARWLVLQGVAVVAFTVMLRGSDALGAGCRTALQLLLLFLPFALLLRTTPSEALLGPLRGRLPERLGIALGATLRLAPVFARELAELVEMQRLRGARLRPRELWHPGAWRDVLACVAFPMTVRAVAVAEEAAEAAEIRGIGSTHDSRALAKAEEAQ